MAEFEKDNYEEIAKDYAEGVLKGTEEIPQKFIDSWLEENYHGSD